MRWIYVLLAAVALLVTVRSSSGQRKHPDNHAKNSILRWDEKDDVHQWLTDNSVSLNRGDGCTLSSSWMNEDDPKAPSTSVRDIASFVTIPEDEAFTALIHDSTSNSGLDVRMGVRYSHDKDNQSPSEIRIALALNGSEDVFTDIGRSEARTIRDSKWQSLSVVKDTMVGQSRYTFILHCENGKTFLDYMKSLPRKRHASR